MSLLRYPALLMVLVGLCIASQHYRTCWLVLVLVGLCLASEHYPTCWIRPGECLDDNQPPLDIAGRVKPDNNSNVLDVVSMATANSTKCSDLCSANTNCSAFSVYSAASKDCQLVGFNLGTACWRLHNTCVLHAQCNQLNSSCSSGCLTGLALPSPKTTLVLGGVTKTRGKNDTFLTNMEVLRHGKEGKESCTTEQKTSPSRMGAVAMAVETGNNTVLLLCGGWTEDNEEDPPRAEYVNTCHQYNANQWIQAEAKINTKRAFAAGVGVGSEAYILGGYNEVDGFLGSVEVLKDGVWRREPALDLATPTSHACAVEANGNIYLIGGWDNKWQFLPTAALLDVNKKKWTQLPDMEDIYGEKSRRGDHACLSVRRGWDTHIVVAGGYDKGSAWLSSALYLDTSTHNWHKLPRLQIGRHNHGLGVIGLDPVVIGGWNSKVMRSMESLDSCQDGWTLHKRGLAGTREKFAAIVLPQQFHQEFTVIKCHKLE